MVASDPFCNGPAAPDEECDSFKGVSDDVESAQDTTSSIKPADRIAPALSPAPPATASATSGRAECCGFSLLTTIVVAAVLLLLLLAGLGVGLGVGLTKSSGGESSPPPPPFSTPPFMGGFEFPTQAPESPRLLPSREEPTPSPEAQPTMARAPPAQAPSAAGIGTTSAPDSGGNSPGSISPSATPTRGSAPRPAAATCSTDAECGMFFPINNASAVVQYYCNEGMCTSGVPDRFYCTADDQCDSGECDFTGLCALKFGKNCKGEYDECARSLSCDTTLVVCGDSDVKQLQPAADGSCMVDVQCPQRQGAQYCVRSACSSLIPDHGACTLSSGCDSGRCSTVPDNNGGSQRCLSSPGRACRADSECASRMCADGYCLASSSAG